MLVRTAIATASLIAFSSAEAGCGITFQFAFADSSGSVVEYLPPQDFYDLSDTSEVTVPDALFFRASAAFPSCFVWEAKLWRNGVLIQEWWTESVTWTTNEPGLYKWTVEGIGNMGAGPITRHFHLVNESAVALGPEFLEHDFILRSLIVSQESRHAQADIISMRASDLHVEIFSLDGRSLHVSMHPILQGYNRVEFLLPPTTGALTVFRLTTREGVLRTRKLVL